MTKVIAGASVSLDGFIADEADRVGPLFEWYGNGDVAFNGGDPERVFHVSAASAAYLERTWSRIGGADGSGDSRGGTGNVASLI